MFFGSKNIVSLCKERELEERKMNNEKSLLIRAMIRSFRDLRLDIFD